jgi:polyhydroxybutyrate depolymerase
MHRHPPHWQFVCPAAALLGLLAGCCTGLTKHPLVHDGRNRVYYLHEPANYTNPAPVPVPLVIVLHGAANDGCDAARMTKMNDKSDDEGFLVAYPNGTGWCWNRTWNADLCCDPARANGVDDVGFIEAVMDEIEGNHRVDPKRIYVAGFSNGAMMAHVAACRLADRIAAIAPVAGPVDPGACTPSAPVSVITFHGDADQRVRYGGGQFPASIGGQSYPSVHDVVEFWCAHDHCTTSLPPHETGSVRIEEHTDGDDDTAVVLYTILGGNHSWPGGQQVSWLGQPPTQAESATDRIWEFFAQHPKP